ncbi:hypothetical protein QP185_08930 [Sphingomonas aerolata]|uniref:hypothetical protein n=1 Tax=Sphingomonas aerolata TaxID=185951 RepID=UPI002FE0CE79
MPTKNPGRDFGRTLPSATNSTPIPTSIVVAGSVMPKAGAATIASTSIRIPSSPAQAVR